jgi:ABC-2 type transport system permease protein
MRLWLRYVAIILRSQMQYRLSSVMLFFGQLLSTLSGFLGIYLLFERFGSVDGWTFHEVALFYGVVTLSFSITEMTMRGFDVFSRLIRAGDFDRLMLRPRGLELQVLGSQFEWTRLGRMLQGAVVLFIALRGLEVPWTAWRAATLALTILGGVAVFTGIFILTSTMCFWTIQGLEFANLLTDGGRQMGQYPMTIYRDGFRRFFTYVIPFGLVNFIPLQYVLARGGSQTSILAPLAAVLFLAPCLTIWQLGVRHYKSTGS